MIVLVWVLVGVAVGGVDCQVALLRNGGHFCRDSTSPVDDGPKDIEGEHLEIGTSAAVHVG